MLRTCAVAAAVAALYAVGTSAAEASPRHEIAAADCARPTAAAPACDASPVPSAAATLPSAAPTEAPTAAPAGTGRGARDRHAGGRRPTRPRKIPEA